MIDQAFTTLEYATLLKLARRYAQTPMGQSRIESLTPIEHLSELRRALAAVDETVRLRQRGVFVSFSGINDPQDALARLRVEDAPLDPMSILQLGRICEQSLTARSLIQAERQDCPVLWQVVSLPSQELNSVVARITTKIQPSGELDDRASPELARIRHEITRLRSQITRSLESLMHKYGEAIQDPLVTVRNERFVIPVRSDHRGRVQGVAHGFSSSGATVFVEPLATIDANNELQSLRESEEREIARVLLELTEILRAALPGIESAAMAVEELDFINAKAIFSEKFSCAIPEVVAKGREDKPPTEVGEGSETLQLTEARHPLLEENLRQSGGSVIPISFSLDEQHRAIVISGANAGGKTVVLKTAGLLALMALSGLPVPALHARVPFYSSVLADIGDHQSLAANLSTFTSHVANISNMIQLCRAPGLVLLDEVGTGTDPEEGSALGVAVVDHFRRSCGAHVMATTHYSGLKMYAANEDGVLNASVEFDEKTLKPTYRLIVGVAGSSSGLEIARRFGIPDRLVKDASELVSTSSLQAGEYLRRIKSEAEQATALRAALEEEREAVAERFASLDEQAARHERERLASLDVAIRRTIEEFEQRGRELVSHVQDRTDRLKLEKETQKQIAHLKREAQRTVQTVLANAGENVSRQVRILRGGQLVETNKPTGLSKIDEPSVSDDSLQYKPVAEDRKIKVGDRVRLRSFNSIGIVDQLKDDEAEVRVKALRFRQKLDDLELVEVLAEPEPEAGKFARLRGSKSNELSFKTTEEIAASEINVIGQTTDEAVEAVDKFLDKAALASLTTVRIVHGHGTGALRRAIGDFLKGHPHVARFSAAPMQQGGGGVTIVEMSS